MCINTWGLVFVVLRVVLFFFQVLLQARSGNERILRRRRYKRLRIGSLEWTARSSDDFKL
jgi:hypothetical protein